MKQKWVTPVRQLQKQQTGVGSSSGGGGTSGGFKGVLKGKSSNSDAYNGVSSLLWLEPSAADPNIGGVTIKRTESTWGVTSPYGSGQPFEVLSPSTTNASDLSTDGTGSGGSNPVLCRIDAFGGIGTVQGVHISPGLRNTYGGGTPIGLWVQLVNVDTYGVIASGPDPAKVATPFSPLFQAQTFAGAKLWNVDSLGDMNMYASNGTTGLVALASGDTPAFGHRAILRAGSAGTAVLGLRREAAQTAAFVRVLKEDGTTLLSAIDPGGDFVTFADDGTTGVGAVYAGSTPAVGFRALFASQTAATVTLGLKLAASQSQDVMATYNSAGTKIATIIDSTGHLTGGGGSGVTSFNTRTGAVTLTSADITALGGALVPIQSSPFGYMLYTNGSGGTFWSTPPSSSGVTSWNGRTGAVSLTSSDITALGGQLIPTPPASGTHQLYSVSGTVTWI